MACFLNHYLTINRQYTTQAVLSPSPPALFAVSSTAFVMMGLFGLVTLSSSISYGITCSIWCFSRRQILVTSLGSMAGGWTCSRRVGRTGEY